MYCPSSQSSFCESNTAGAEFTRSSEKLAIKLAEELRTNGTPTDADTYHAMVERLKAATGLKGKVLFMPLRLAITGLDHGPELVRSIPLLRHASEVDARVLSPLSRVERCIA